MAKKEKLLATAQKLLQKNQLAKAIKQYEKALSLDDKDFRCRQKLAELYSRQGEVDKAISHYEKVAAYYADHAFYLKAIAVYKQMQKLDPENTGFTLKLAKFNEQQGLIGNALSEYRVLIKHYETNNDLQSALDILERVRELDPDNINVAAKISGYYAQAGNQDKALLVFKDVETQLKEKANYKHLQTFYEHFLKLWPDNLAVKLGYGVSMLEFGEPLGGVQYLTRLFRQYPQDTEVLDALAAGLHKCNEYAREVSCLQKLIKLEPEALDARVRLFQATLDADDPNACFAALEDSREAFFAAERVVEIKPFYERVHEMLPEKREVVDGLRLIYEHLGEGEKLFNTLADYAPEEPEAEVSEEIFATQAADTAAFEPAQVEAESDLDSDFDDIMFDTVDDAEEVDFDLDSFDLPAQESAPSVDVAADLEEVDFYMQQGLLAEAQQACKRLAEAAPGNSEVQQRLDKIQRLCEGESSAGVGAIEAQSPQAEVEEPSGATEEDAAGLVAGSLETEDDSFSDFDLSLDEDFDLDIEGPGLADSQRGVQTVIGDEDTDSAYNLGIAYKEMGLYSDAIAEFNKAMVDPARKVACITLQAECYSDQQLYEKAEEVLTTGLSITDLSMEERIALYYETGLLYEACGRHADALSSYQVVADKIPEFREVASKVAHLKEVLGIEDDVSRVSYV